jgi:large subunit ribosomal protein L19
MNTSLLTKVEQANSKSKLPNVAVGDTVEVSTIIREGDKQRIQKFKGLVIAIKGSGTKKMFTVRKISYGIGVEKIFPFHSPNVGAIAIIKHGNVRRSKLYYMRDRIGRLAMKVRAGEPVVVVENANAEEAMPEANEEIEVVTAEQVEAVRHPEAVEATEEVAAPEAETTETAEVEVAAEAPAAESEATE